MVVYHFNGKADAEALRANWKNGITARREPVLEGYTLEDVKAEGQIGVVRLSVDSGIRAQQLAPWLGGEPLMSSR